LQYQPREPEVRHFLMRFVQDHYGRIRATARDAFQRNCSSSTPPMPAPRWRRKAAAKVCRAF
jgi:hypothetical protein